MTIMVLGKKQTLVVFQIWRIKMDRNEKLNHMLALTEEINVLTQRIEPHDTGHLHTAISVIQNRIEEIT